LKEINYPPIFSTAKISLQVNPNSRSRPQLAQNEVVVGKVLKSLPAGKALIQIKGSVMVARTPYPLNEGVTLSLKVEDLSPSPTLKLLGLQTKQTNPVNTSIIVSAIEENLWKSTLENMGQFGLEKGSQSLLKELLTDLTLRLFSKPNPELLKEIIERSGVNWEAKLKRLLSHKTPGGPNLDRLIEGDLKGLISKFADLDEKKSSQLSRLVTTIKNIQLLNHDGLDQDRKIFLPVPMQFPDGFFTVGQLLMHLPQTGKDGCEPGQNTKKSFKITFLLDLSRLGPLRADLTVKGKEIAAQFLLTNEEAKLIIEKGIPVFIERVKELGFSLSIVEYHIREKEVIRHALIKELIKEEGGNISLVA
jgi:hypothetical protein